MRNIHLFETVSAFTESYEGKGYLEPWVSYTRENTHVDYNKPKELNLRVPYYDSESALISEGAWTDEEVEILNNIFDYIIPDSYTEDIWQNARLKDNVIMNFYYVSGVVEGFDPSDPSTYYHKTTVTKDTEIELRIGSIDTPHANSNLLIDAGVSSGSYNFLIEAQYDFDDESMVLLREFYGDVPN